jgi:hypothetical protein
VTLEDALGSGRLANADAVLWVRESIVDAGPSAGNRAIDVRTWEGIGCRILPDRGLDLGQAWYRGVPLAWVSEAGETGPLEHLEDLAWTAGFGGGLVVTCGLRNVGMPAEGHGLHGTFSHLSAADLKVGREVSGDAGTVVVSGTLLDADPVAPFRVDRTIRVLAGTGRIDLQDVTTNLGLEPAPAPLLYHCNFGYPLWSPPARLEMEVAATTARDPDSAVALDCWHLPPALEPAPERVLEHTLPEGTSWGTARIVNPELGVAVTVSWDRAELPRLNQWLDPNPGMAVLGIEPANCSTGGRAHDRARGRLPMLEPGRERTTRLRLEAVPC